MKRQIRDQLNKRMPLGEWRDTQVGISVLLKVHHADMAYDETHMKVYLKNLIKRISIK